MTTPPPGDGDAQPGDLTGPGVRVVAGRAGRRRAEQGERRRGRRVLGMLLGLLLTALLTSVASYALLMATATGTAEAVGTGTLKLELSDNGTGFSAGVANMLPTDSVTRYVEVRNSGLLDGRDLALAVLPASDNTLVNDPAKGLQLAVSACPVAWTPATGVCAGGGDTLLLATTPLSAMRTTATAQPLQPSLAAGATAHLRLVLSLPDQTETTVNGVLPSPTIQGLTNLLTYTFSITQRAGTSTGS
ncbi:hypothetical protein [Goekera deserti]|uniref:Camelysin metallo-endopeptidase n=1 Tax=Goekera deserti TaxID=2497753 RepID=A0A7K3WEG0_9ACTN|nr:hypothetical protein [Goekera deserti]NDI46281.1 hypothetical protein [Goekera deserti]NEL54787.1 hypothetical protein [Goekera deserti]